MNPFFNSRSFFKFIYKELIMTSRILLYIYLGVISISAYEVYNEIDSVKKENIRKAEEVKEQKLQILAANSRQLQLEKFFAKNPQF